MPATMPTAEDGDAQLRRQADWLQRLSRAALPWLILLLGKRVAELID
jgi:hypothetical protein